MSTKFYGDKKISHVEENGEKHYDVYFSDGKMAKMSKKMHDASVSKKSTDLTTLWDRQLGVVAKETLQLWLDWDLQLEQLDYMFNLLKTSIEYNNKRAGNVVWGKPLEERTMSTVDDVLHSDKEKERENKDGK